MAFPSKHRTSDMPLLYRRGVLLASKAVRALLVFALTLTACAPAVAQPAILFDEHFASRAEGLITNEYAYRLGDARGGRRDALWEVTSGSLFVRHGRGYTGIPDHLKPNVSSSNGTNSAVFRARTKRADFGDVTVDLDLRNAGVADHTGVPPHAYDGVHVWLRYQSEYQLYAVTVNRRDQRVEIKKKMPGGPSNGGTYHTLSEASYAVPYGALQHVRTSIHNNANGSIAIALWIDGALVVSAVDTGSADGPPILGAGRVGIRGDNCEFSIGSFRVTSWSGFPGATNDPAAER